MFARLLSLAASILLPAASLHAEPVTPDQLMRHIRVLASDAYEGRRPGTSGGERTEAYVLEAFAAAGLAPGADGGSWRQPVGMIERISRTSSLSFNAAGRSFAVDSNHYFVIGEEEAERVADAPVIFVGHGLSSTWEDLDIQGALILMLAEDPPGDGTAPSLVERRAVLAEAGAGGVIAIAPAGAPWEAARAYYGGNRISPQARPFAPVEGMISRDAASAMLQRGGLDLGDLTQQAGSQGFLARRLDVTAGVDAATQVRSFETANIIGMIEGSSRPGEAVVLMAHWDHLGICRPEDAPDRICNGAIDNASGIAILIESARAIAAGERPERSIYFVATTSEELGLLGAEAFAAALPPRIERIVAALNVDTTAIAPEGLPVAIVGRGRYPSIDRIIDETSRSLGRAVDEDLEANLMIRRQDGWALTRRGIPSLMATGSVSDMGRLSAYLSGPYHKPEDDLSQDIELGGAIEDTALHIVLIRALADPERLPSP